MYSAYSVSEVSNNELFDNELTKCEKKNSYNKPNICWRIFLFRQWSSFSYNKVFKGFVVR